MLWIRIFRPYKVIISACVAERSFYWTHSLTCSFWWSCFQSKILYLQKHFCFNITLERQSGNLLFRFTENNPNLTSKNIIFGISTRNWVDLCTFQIVCGSFCGWKFFPWFPIRNTSGEFIGKVTWTRNTYYNSENMLGLEWKSYDKIFSSISLRSTKILIKWGSKNSSFLGEFFSFQANVMSSNIFLLETACQDAGHHGALVLRCWRF